jgi:hypothetical protein
MYYEIDSTGKKLRPLPGYFDGFKKDLEKVDKSLLSDTQADYISIDPARIIELTEEEHAAYILKQQQDLQSVMDSQKYLADTDYKIIKEMETGEKCPEDVLLKRAECRTIINELRGE